MNPPRFISRIRPFVVALFLLGCGNGGGHGDGNAPADTRFVPDSLPWCHPGPPCPDGWFVNTDTICPYKSECSNRGDKLCYQKCSTGSDCTDPRFPYCSSLIYYNSTDFPWSKLACQGTELPRCDSIFDAGN